jgi:alkylated DNA repair dioxygenase AlkB
MRKSARAAAPPEGFRYEEELVPPDEENELVRLIEKLPLTEFQFHGYTGKRRTVSFGWHYEFADSTLNRTSAIPDFLLALRNAAASFAGLKAQQLPHVLVTEYTPGTPIGWHRDKVVFEDVIGISLLSGCTFRFRRKVADGWERYNLTLEPRSIYLLRGPARTEWEHSIPAVDSLRYSITFRSLR